METSFAFQGNIENQTRFQKLFDDQTVNFSSLPFMMLDTETNATVKTAWRLSYIKHKLTLCYGQKYSYNIDFHDAAFLNRIQPISKKPAIIKACEGRKQNKRQIIDATAGLGTDSLTLASRGHKVKAIEAHPVLFALLKDALIRARQSVDLAPIIERIQLFYGDAKALLPECSEADVIYLDPMFPDSQTKAKPKKSMQLLQKLLTPDYQDIRITKDCLM
jgi:16S rRNA (guanine1516-N2)-methyltransferase